MPDLLLFRKKNNIHWSEIEKWTVEFRKTLSLQADDIEKAYPQQRKRYSAILGNWIFHELFCQYKPIIQRFLCWRWKANNTTASFIGCYDSKSKFSWYASANLFSSRFFWNLYAYCTDCKFLNLLKFRYTLT